jgi:hypothetical protein
MDLESAAESDVCQAVKWWKQRYPDSARSMLLGICYNTGRRIELHLQPPVGSVNMDGKEVFSAWSHLQRIDAFIQLCLVERSKTWIALS